MNKDVHSIFEAYLAKRTSILTEAPVELQRQEEIKGSEEELGKVVGEVPVTFGQSDEKNKVKYFIDKSGIKDVVVAYLLKFKADGGKTIASYTDHYKNYIAPIVKEKTNLNNTLSKYAARCVYDGIKNAGWVKDERDGVQGSMLSRPEGQKKSLNQVVDDIANMPIDKGSGADEPGEEAPAKESPVNIRIANWVLEQIDSVAGASENEVVTDVQRKILSSGGLGLEERSIVSKVKAVISKLVSDRILERKAGRLIFGDVEFAPNEEGTEFKSVEDTIRDITGFGARKTTGREIWSQGE